MKEKERNSKVFSATSLTILSFYTLLLFIPLFWVTMTSFKSTYEFSINKIGLPDQLTFSNFINAIDLYIPIGTKKVYMEQMLFNSLLFCALYSVVPIYASSTVAYACARYPSKYGKVLLNAVVFFMVFPVIGGLSGAMQLAIKIGTYDNIWKAILLQFNFGGASFLVYYGAFKGVPRDYSEAAQLDGAGHFRIMFLIIFPMVMPIIKAYFITTLVGLWNDWTTALTWFPSSPTIAYGLYRFSSGSTGNTAANEATQCATCVISAIPMIVFFAIFKKQIIGKVSIGGIKG